MPGDAYLELAHSPLTGKEKWEFLGEGLCFLFVRTGAGKLTAENASRRLNPGDVLVLNARTKPAISAAEEGEVRFEQFSLKIEHMYPLFAVSEMGFLRDLAASFDQTKLYAAATPLAAECHKLVGEAPAQRDLGHRTHLLRIVGAIFSHELKTIQISQPGYVSMEEHLVQVFKTLSIDDLLNLSAVELAARFGCSRRHLNRLFHQYLRYSVSALRMELRMLKAVSLLKNRAAKIIDVADECGFSHLGLFNTCFKRRFGKSPGQWRKESGSTKGRSGGDASATCPLQINGLCPWIGQLQDGPHVSPSPQQTQKPGLSMAPLGLRLPPMANGSQVTSFCPNLVP